MIVFAVALLAQTGVFFFVHFTDSHTEIVAVPEPASSAVVEGGPLRGGDAGRAAMPNASGRGPASAEQTGTLVVRGRVINLGQPGTTDQEDASRAQAINSVETAMGLRLRHVSDTARTFGVLSAIMLCLLMFQGVAVGSAARVPGIHHIVSSTTWMLLIAGLTVPLATLVPDVPWGGVFTGYDAMLDQSALLRDGHGQAPAALGFYAQHLLVPLCCLAGLVAVVFRYNSAVEDGIIVTHSSQLDEKVEREIRELGAGHSQMPRSVGALNAAIGATETDEDNGHSSTLSGPRAKKPMPRPI